MFRKRKSKFKTSLTALKPDDSENHNQPVAPLPRVIANPNALNQISTASLGNPTNSYTSQDITQLKSKTKGVSHPTPPKLREMQTEEKKLKDGDILTENSQNQILSQSEEEELQNWENMKLKSGNYLIKRAIKPDSTREESLLKNLRASIYRPESEVIKEISNQRSFLEQSVQVLEGKSTSLKEELEKISRIITETEAKIKEESKKFIELSNKQKAREEEEDSDKLQEEI